MLLEPTLRVSAMRIHRDRNIVYEANFHSGVNIVRGQNSTGKSTILDFIFYGLGGEDVPWKNEALLCDHVTLEVFLNGIPISLRRQVNDSIRNPMSIFWGPLNEAFKSSVSDWETYPYQRSTSKESFSQVLFRSLGLPELRGEGAANITMHQLLRLMYSDQRTPHDEIFRAEAFESDLNRETIGNYLCGVYSADLYEAQIELKQVESDLTRAVSDLRNIFAVLGKSGQGGATTLEFLQAEAAAVNEEMAVNESHLQELRKSNTVDQKAPAAQRLAKLRKELNDAQQNFSKAQSRLAELELEDKDSELFLREIDRRLVALDDSQKARSYLGSLRFQFCPCCLSATSTPSDGKSCHLCRNDLSEAPGDAQILRMKNELEIQKRESTALMKSRVNAINENRQNLESFKINLKNLEREFFKSGQTWSTPHEIEIETTSRKLGELSQRLKQISEYLKLANVLNELQQKRGSLEHKRSTLQEKIELLLSENEDVKKNAKHAIAEELLYLLKNELPRQDEFISATAVDWSFGKNRVAVNGATQFSESSMVILRHSFHVALLIASAKEKFFRFPRFLMIDGIEDGGQEQQRAFKFQKLIVDRCESLENEYQIIYATSEIEPSLNTDDYTVGKSSTTDDKTLSII
ncbi:AAA family ATPase [Xenophilus arseniciresistens]|uniref:AAA family ATPase n=1 Tax=Xenophilus arseniciresistens TaxID=1283306 RepID=A0AAE3T086_9BURK|nr:AAA family ATPase [Xenophilus arseniciresistens]MDA7416661.1 AAA family ATPase [Xenophilus arseniciresistens]